MKKSSSPDQFETPDGKNAGTPPLRLVAAVFIGLICAFIIWIVGPINNYLLANINISDSYMPGIVLFLTLVLVLVVNPLLKLAWEPLRLRSGELAIIVGIMLVACVTPGWGVMKTLPYSLAKTSIDISQDQQLAQQYEKMDLPPSMFPDQIGFNKEAPASRAFTSEMLPDQSLADFTGAWVGPMLMWGSFLLFGWMMMIGMSLIVMPQWRDNERLAFPLLTVQRSLIDDPDKGRFLPPMLRRKGFWVAAGLVFFIHLLSGLSEYRPEDVPAVPLSWDLWHLFTEAPWNYMPGYIKQCSIYFAFVGIAFFMSTRMSFSIWFFLIVYGMWRAFAPAYGNNNYIEQMDNHRLGAILVVSLIVLFIGRKHWAEVFGTLLRRARTPADRRNRGSAIMFLAGIAGMMGWLMFTGVEVHWAALLVVFAFIMSLIVVRFVAESGVPAIRLYDQPLLFMKYAPISWLSPVAVFMSGMITMFFTTASRSSLAPLATHGLALDDDARPRRQLVMGIVFLAVLLIGLVVAGYVHLDIGYNNATTLTGTVLNPDGGEELDGTNDDLKELASGQLSKVHYNEWAHIGFGAAISALLYWACLTLPTWPIHPLGYLLIDSYFGHVGWASVMFGWLCKVFVVKLGGARLYDRARGFFLGMIVGEVFAAAFWAGVNVLLVMADHPYKVIRVLPF